MKIETGQAYSFCQQGQRSNQEDARYPDTDTAPLGQRFFVVCDGVGGSERGETASHEVCRAFGKALGNGDFAHEDFTNEHFSQALDAAYDTLDRAARKGSRDMGTTLTFAAFHAGGATLAHIGDSRIYQIRPAEGFVYRSGDHSLVNQMVHSGLITPEEAETHPQRNVITRCMEPVLEDQSRCMATVYRTQDIKAGDYFLLCTDGVLHQLTDEALTELLASELTDEQKMQQMARCSADSPDNNTAYLIHIKEVSGKEEKADTQAQTSDTRRNASARQQVEEIESVQQPPKRSLQEIVKKMFNRIIRII